MKSMPLSHSAHERRRACAGVDPLVWFVADAGMVCVSVLTDALPCLAVPWPWGSRWHPAAMRWASKGG